MASELVLESNADFGKSWSLERLYPSLKTNNQLSTYEFSDFPMEEFGINPGNHIPGHVVHEYLKAYAEKFDISRLIRYGCRVKSIEKLENYQWRFTFENEELLPIQAVKLVVATGMTSDPVTPKFSGEDLFRTPIFHSMKFSKHKDYLSTAKNVVILTGSKRACDVVYNYAEAGVHVDWIIWKSGNGSVWISKSLVTPFKIRIERLITTRICARPSGDVEAETMEVYALGRYKSIYPPF